MPAPRAIEVSARTGQGIEAWVAWLAEQRAPLEGAVRTGGDTGHTHPHAHQR